jgi:hypothetical protein
MVSPISAGGGFTRTGIATIVDMNSNEVEVDVNEAYIARVSWTAGDFDAGCVSGLADPFACAYSSDGGSAKATVKVRISFDKLDPRILPDMGVKVCSWAKKSKRRARRRMGPKPVALIPKGGAYGRREVLRIFGARSRIERRGVTLGNDRGSMSMMAG